MDPIPTTTGQDGTPAQDGMPAREGSTGQDGAAPVTIVVLTEQALGADDASRIAALHPDESLAYRVLVPADTERNLLLDVVDHLSLFELREAVSAVRGGDETPAQARADAEQALGASLAALGGLGVLADGEITADNPLPALAAAVARWSAREVVVVTRPHVVADTVHRDWGSRAREELGVPVLHLYAGSGRLG